VQFELSFVRSPKLVNVHGGSAMHRQASVIATWHDVDGTLAPWARPRSRASQEPQGKTGVSRITWMQSQSLTSGTNGQRYHAASEVAPSLIANNATEMSLCPHGCPTVKLTTGRIAVCRVHRMHDMQEEPDSGPITATTCVRVNINKETNRI
jgi:hypothetical protein